MSTTICYKNFLTGWEMYSKKCKVEFENYMKQKGTVANVNEKLMEGAIDVEEHEKLADDENEKQEVRWTDENEFKYIMTNCDRTALRNKYGVTNNDACTKDFYVKGKITSYVGKLYQGVGQTDMNHAVHDDKTRLKSSSFVEGMHIHENPVAQRIKHSFVRNSNNEKIVHKEHNPAFGNYTRCNDFADNYNFIPPFKNYTNVNDEKNFMKGVKKLSKNQKRAEQKRLPKFISCGDDWEEYLETEASNKAAVDNVDKLSENISGSNSLATHSISGSTISVAKSLGTIAEESKEASLRFENVNDENISWTDDTESYSDFKFEENYSCDGYPVEVASDSVYNYASITKTMGGRSIGFGDVTPRSHNITVDTANDYTDDAVSDHRIGKSNK